MIRKTLGFTLASLLLLSSAAVAENAQKKAEPHTHSHAHDHSPEAQSIYKGYFDDDQIKSRDLSDWEGDWQSVYPHLLDGSLDTVMAHKAEHGDKSAAEYREEYAVGYKTDVDRIVIKGDKVTFHRSSKVLEATYASDGYEVLNYRKGNRGVRYIFKKSGGDDAAPQFIQFSDHTIAPTKAGHYHLYWGNDRAEVLRELTNWPTYYPASLSAKEIAQEMMEH